MRVNLPAAAVIRSTLAPISLKNIKIETVKRLGLGCLAAIGVAAVLYLLAGRLKRCQPVETALWLNRVLAVLGNPHAQRNAAQFLLEQAKGHSEQLLRKAAAQGDAEACFRLGGQYKKGQDVQQNDRLAFEYFERAARLNHADALFVLGITYQEGYLNIEKNFARAIELYRRAAEQGSGEAQYFLGHHYENGWNGQEPDFQAAERYYLRAAEQGQVNAQSSLAELYATSNPAESRRWYASAAEQGDIVANNAMGRIVQAEGDNESAKTFYKLAADNGDISSQIALAKLLEDENDFDQASNYYRMAANEGCVEALLALARFNKKGLGSLGEDISLAKVFYKYAAAHGSIHAHYKLAKIYLSGSFGREIKRKKALEHLIIAANKGHPRAELLFTNNFKLGVSEAAAEVPGKARVYVPIADVEIP